jgi:regulator of sigma E protease
MIITILFGIIGFGIMVFVHELGHFLAAKRVGIEVEAFSLGWGRRLIGFKYKGTDYRLSLIPFGGYCKMKGELPVGWADPASDPASGGSRPERPAPDPTSFFGAAPWKRIVVAVSGPLANVVFALLVLTAIWWIGFRVFSADNRIVLASDYTLDSFPTLPPATVAGLKTGDRVVAINGKPIRNFQELLETVSSSPDSVLDFTVERGGVRRQLVLHTQLDKSTGAGRIGVYSWQDLVVDKVKTGSAAALAGLKPGDRIVSVSGVPVRQEIDLAQQLKDRPQRVVLGVQRGSKELSLPVVMRYSEQGAPDLGVSFQVKAYRSPRVGPIGAVEHGLQETWDTAALTVRGIGLLFHGVSVRNAVAGPLKITYYVGSVAASGFAMGVGQGLVNYFRFLSLLSVVLFLMNLLPIPALDGGQVLLALLEVIRRRPVSPRLIARIQTVSFSLLMLVAVAVTFNDILGFLGR